MGTAQPSSVWNLDCLQFEEFTRECIKKYDILFSRLADFTGLFGMWSN